jgi:hypothetical protein
MTARTLNLASACTLALAALLTGPASAAGGQTLNSGDVDTMHLWHGRGAGLEGTNRVALIGKQQALARPIVVTYDEVTVARTNMRRAEAGTSLVTLRADRTAVQDERTGAPVFAAAKKPVQAAGTPTPRAN